MTRVQRTYKQYLSAITKMGETLPALVNARNTFNNWIHLTAIWAGVRNFAPGDRFMLRHPRNVSVQVWDHIDVSTLWTIFCRKEYSVLPSDALILDVGANVGMFSLYAAIQAPNARIVACEPVSRTYVRLSEQLSQIQLQERILLRNCGIGGRSRLAEIYIGESSAMASICPSETHKSHSQSREQIQIVSLTTLIEELESESISLLKMDCEGAEWEIFDETPDETLSRIDRICLEYHPLPGRDRNQIINRLTGIGFTLQKLSERRNGTGVAWFSH